MRDPLAVGAGERALSDQPEVAQHAPQQRTRDVWRDLAHRWPFVSSATIVAILVAIAIAPGMFAGWFGHGDPRACDLSHSAAPPADGHPFGLDLQGCDIYANVIYGARASIIVGILTTLVSVIVALVLGSLAAMSGRFVDGILSRLTDVFLGFPFLLGAVVLLTGLPVRNEVTVALVLALFSWPTMMRVVRASVMSTRQRDYVVAARGLGASTWFILHRHILPNAIAPVIVLATLAVGAVIAAEASLTYLGVGLQSPSISWGLQLASAQNFFKPHPHLLIFPAAFLSVTVLSLITLGEIMRDAFDPRGR
jgi:oligopeptide transport system permease protein